MNPGMVEDVTTTIVNYVLMGALGALGAWVLGRFKAISRRQDKVKAELSAIKLGLRISLRSDLVNMHRRYVVEGRPCPVPEKDRADETYKAYHALGGNGTGTVLWQQIMEEAKVGGSKEWRAAHPEYQPK